ncbi:MAG: plasmid pRiA4b ORF-3 family protein [Terracidiphilus sp.]
MATKQFERGQDIYQLKVTLLGTKPAIWRRLLVPADLTLAQLHTVLQTVMGWENQHMHQFRAGQRRFGRPEPADPFSKAQRVESARTVPLSAVLESEGAKMTYTYDFGDNWEHSIVLDKQLPAEHNTTCPICTDGERACPPEDCGGVPGFYKLLDALANPRHRRHKELRSWIGGEFNPETFSIDKVNQQLSPARRRNKKSAR